MRPSQISTSVSDETRRQADWLIQNFSYSLRDVLTLGIQMLYDQKKEQTMTRQWISNRDNWLETDDPNYVVYIPQFEGEDILVMDRRDGDVPRNLEFNLVAAIRDSVLDEAREVAAESGLTVNTERMAVTFRRD